MRVTIDVDSKVEALGILIRMIQETKQIPEIWLSPSGKGFHFISYGLKCNWDNIIDMRRRIGDDRMRIKLDLIRKKVDRPTDILWTKKVIDGVEFNARKLTFEEFKKLFA